MNMKRMRTYTVLGTTMLLSSCLFVSSNWTEAARDVISFVSVTDRTRPIILMDTQGKILQRLVIPGLIPLSCSWSPDGRSFAYHTNEDGNFDIYVMDMETQTTRRLTFDGGKDLSPAWSPNGKWIAFVSDRTGSRDIYRMDVDGGNLMQLTKQKGGTKPAWSPDSQSIAFVSTSLFVMSANGNRLKHLADATSMGCSWSPDGKQIAFISKDAEGGMDIFSINVNGKNLRQLTWLDQQVFIFGTTWAPNGKWIAYVLAEVIGPLKPVLGADDFAAPVVCLINAIDGGIGKPIEATRGLVSGSIEWVPKVLFSVSPNEEKQITLWSRLKQSKKNRLRNLSVMIFVNGHKFRANQLLRASGTLCQ